MTPTFYTSLLQAVADLGQLAEHILGTVAILAVLGVVLHTFWTHKAVR